MPTPDVPPHGEAVVRVPFRAPSGDGGDYRLNLGFSLAKSTLWASRGFEVAWAQFDLPVECAAPAPRRVQEMPKVRVEDTAEAIVVSGDDFRLVFDRWTAAITAWQQAGLELVLAGPKPQLWRAPTDNDVHIARQWRMAGLDRLMPRVESVCVESAQPTAVRIAALQTLTAYGVATKIEWYSAYTVYGTGDVVVESRFVPLDLHVADWSKREALTQLPRLGWRMILPAEYDRFTWYGRGPHESYVDRRESTRFGVYSGSVAEQLVPYIKPQENGNKSDVRWASVTDIRGRGVLVAGMPSFEVSVHHLRAEDFTQARHHHELQPRKETVLNVDYAHNGLGSNSCGPVPLEKYWLKPAPVRFAVRLKPVAAEEMSLMAASRCVPEPV